MTGDISVFTIAVVIGADPAAPHALVKVTFSSGGALGRGRAKYWLYRQLRMRGGECSIGLTSCLSQQGGHCVLLWFGRLVTAAQVLRGLGRVSLEQCVVRSAMLVGKFLRWEP